MSILFNDIESCRQWIQVDTSWKDVDVQYNHLRDIAAYTIFALNRNLDPILHKGLPSKIIVCNDPNAGSPLVYGGVDYGSTAVIRLSIQGNFWSQIIFQFAHELGHVFARSWGKHWDNTLKHMWLEESYCGALSILALERAAGVWYEFSVCNHRAYYSSIQIYKENEIKSWHGLKNFNYAEMQQWFLSNKNNIEQGTSLNDHNKPFAYRLYKLMASNPESWRDIISINHKHRKRAISIQDHLDAWSRECQDIGTPGILPSFSKKALLG